MNKSNQLQSLRGIAVALVVLFHMGFSQFHNGWIGVDIFFVISGFLMWELYRNPILKGNYADFYIRRLKRLLPAISVLLIISNFFFFFRFLPYERGLLTSEIATASIFASNVNYWMGDQYFSNGSLRPLLNLWSIALEIQFYLLFPFLVRFIKSSKARFVFLFTLSFLTFILLSVVSPQTNFFLLPGRLWEFLMGVLVAAFVRVNIKYRPSFILLFLVGLAFLAFTLGLSLNRNQYIAFQIGTVCIFALLIWASWTATNKNIVFSALSKLGNYSYSIYLIHFPLLVFIAYQPFLGNPSGIRGYRDLLLFVSLLAVLSWLSKHYLEDSVFFRRNFIKVWGVSLSFSILLLFLQPLMLTIGFSNKEVAVSNASTDRGEFRCGLLLRLPLFSEPSKTCLLDNSLGGSKKVLLIGNSHANAIKEAVVEALPTKSVYLLNENSPLNSSTLETYKVAISELLPTVVILHSSSGTTDLKVLEDLLKFTKNLNIEFIVIDSVPTPGFDVPSTAYRLLQADRDLNNFKDSNFTIQSYRSKNRNELDLLSRLASNKEILRISVADLFCNPFCQIVDSQSLKPLYFDSEHLTKTGASKLISRINTAVG
jgi:peptidoglycan/LPS O-acetylase OafA/YrhL